MLSINTNLSSLIAQSSLKDSTDILNQAIERMTTGYKLNHAKDNAANYSISTNITTKMNSYMVAQDNAAMGLDMVATMSENLDLVSNHARRIRDLCEQASNGTYGNEAIKAIQAEIDSRIAEITRLQSTAEFNGIKLLESKSNNQMHVTGRFIEEVDQLTEEEAIAQGYTIIKTADDLQNMQNNLSGKYILMNDIDLDGYNWTPVGADYNNDFSGELNGNGFVIRNLEINNPTANYQGLFGHLSGTTIKNLGIENASVVGNNHVGILIGYGYGDNIENVYCSGDVSGQDYIGGVIGDTNSEILNDVYSNCIVVGNYYVGGIVGAKEGATGPTFTNCYSSGLVSGNEFIGGIIGETSEAITNCYSNCVVSGSNYIGGLAGTSYGTIENSYWDAEKSRIAGVGGGSPSGTYTHVTTAELQALIDNGTLPSAKAPVIPFDTSIINLQVGINGDTDSQIALRLASTLTPLNISVTDSATARSSLAVLDSYLAQISDYQTNFGAVTNRLESVLDEIAIRYDNLASSRSTIRDADMAELSSTYIQQQILQQASATLMSTANQSPSLALQLI